MYVNYRLLFGDSWRTFVAVYRKYHRQDVWPRSWTDYAAHSECHYCPKKIIDYYKVLHAAS